MNTRKRRWIALAAAIAIGLTTIPSQAEAMVVRAGSGCGGSGYAGYDAIRFSFPQVELAANEVVIMRVTAINMAFQPFGGSATWWTTGSMPNWVSYDFGSAAPMPMKNTPAVAHSLPLPSNTTAYGMIEFWPYAAGQQPSYREVHWAINTHNYTYVCVSTNT